MDEEGNQRSWKKEEERKSTQGSASSQRRTGIEVSPYPFILSFRSYQRILSSRLSTFHSFPLNSPPFVSTSLRFPWIRIQQTRQEKRSERTVWIARANIENGGPTREVSFRLACAQDRRKREKWRQMDGEKWWPRGAGMGARFKMRDNRG